MSNIPGKQRARCKSTRSKGYGLLEIALGIAIAALLVAGAMMYFNNASEARQNKETLEFITAVTAAVRAQFSGQPDYEAITTPLLAQSPHLPRKFKKQNSIISPFSKHVTLRPTDNNRTFELRLHGLPDSACIAILSAPLYTTNLWVNHVQLPDARNVRTAEAVQRCNNSYEGANMLHLRFN